MQSESTPVAHSQDENTSLSFLDCCPPAESLQPKSTGGKKKQGCEGEGGGNIQKAASPSLPITLSLFRLPIAEEPSSAGETRLSAGLNLGRGETRRLVPEGLPDPRRRTVHGRLPPLTTWPCP